MRGWWIPLWVGVACGVRSAPVPEVVVVQQPPSPDAEHSPIASILAGFGYVQGLPVALQREQLAKWEHAFEARRSPADRLRVALVLLLGDPDVRDEARGVELLKTAAWSDEQASYEAFGQVLLLQWERVEGLGAEVKEARAAVDKEVRRRKAAEERVAELQVMEERLERLKALESDLGDREDSQESGVGDG